MSSKILDLAAQGIFYRPLNTGPAPATEEDGDFVRGLKKAGHQIPQTAGGAIALVGDAVGSDGMRDYGMGVYQKREEEIQKISKPSDSLSNVLEGEGDAIDWLQNSAGYVAGQVGSAVLTGGAGGFIGKQLAQRGIKHIIDRGVTSQAAKLVAEKVARRGAMAGAGTAMFGNNLTQEAGSIYPDAVREAESQGRTLDGSDLARVGGSALAAAGMETAMDALMMGRVMSGGRRAGEGMAKAAVRELPMAMAREGVTEGIQTGIERWGAQKELGTADAIREYVDSIGVGMVGGGMGGALSVLHAQKVPDTGPLSRAANTAIDQEILQLTNDPEPLIVFPDGTTGHKAELEAYIKQFPEENGQRNAVRAKLMGLDEKTGEPIEQEAPPEPEFAASQAEQDARLADYAAEHEPATLEYAHSLLAAPGAKGKNLMVAPHPSGQGYTVVPANWLTLDTQATLGQLQKPQPAAPKEKGKAPAKPEPAPAGQPDTAWQDNPYSAYKFADAELAAKFMANKQADPEKFWVQPEGDKFVVKPKTVAAPAAVEQEAAPAPEAAATIYNPVGQPFVTEFSAKLRLKKDGLSDTHEVAPAEGGGFVLQPKEATNGTGSAAVDDAGSAGRVSSNRPADRTAGTDGLGNVADDRSSEQLPAADGNTDAADGADPVRAVASADDKPALAREFADEVTDSYSGQTNHTLAVREGGKAVGTLEYTVFEGKPAISMIDVPEAHRRKGYGADLVSELQRKFPDDEIAWGGMTEEGSALRSSLDMKEVPTDTAPKFERLSQAIKERDALLAKAEEFQAKDSPTDAEREQYLAAVAPVNDLHDEIYDLEQELNGESPTKKIITGKKEKSANVPEPAQVPEEAKAAQGAQGKEADGQETGRVTEAAPDDGIPKAFYKKVKVSVDVFVEETSTTETAEIPADQALESVRDEIKNLKALIQCMKG